jgi:type IV pilus assembly protein PilW
MKNTSFAHNRGFTLIELMVGLVVGLVVLLAVTQVYVNWESRQRTSSSKNDAQISGTLAAYNLERDLRQAGMGFGSANSTTTAKVGCSVSASVAGAVVNNLNLIPVRIANGASGAADQISVLYGNSAIHSLTVSVIESTASTKRLMNRSGFMLEDKVVLTSTTNPNTCQMVEITVTDPAVVGSTQAFQHLITAYQSPYKTAGVLTTPLMNSATGTVGTFDQAFNLGPEPTAAVWSIGVATPVRPVLLKTNLLPVAGAIPAALDIAEGIVNLQAQYGYDVNNDGQISATEWFDDGDSALAAIQWNRVLAVRYAVLARSRHYEALPFRAANPTWVAGKFVMTDIGGGADSDPAGENNWRAYRYIVYEGAVPLRNVLWGRQL